MIVIGEGRSGVRSKGIGCSVVGGFFVLFWGFCTGLCKRVGFMVLGFKG